MKKILFPLSIIYGLIILIRNRLYDRGIFKVQKFAKIIISVGNITAGGTGKTPVVEFLIEYLMRKQKKIAVISRGYKRKTKGFLLVSDGMNILQNSENSGDEPFQIANKYPNCIVGVDENRSRMAEYICKNHDIDVILLDDAFQHRKIHRDYNIVCINSNQNPFKEFILPAGNRREQIKGLDRADYVLINKCENESDTLIYESFLKERFKVDYSGTTLKPHSFKDLNGNSFSLSEFNERKTIIFSGIADSENFHNKIDNLGISVSCHFRFSDHHYFTEDELSRIINSFKSEKCDCLITTEKDYFRLCQDQQILKLLKDIPLYYLVVKVDFLTKMEKFTEKIDELFYEK